MGKKNKGLNSSWVNKHQQDFNQKNSILSFDECLSELKSSPSLHFRTMAAYLRDVFLFFGYEDRISPTGKARRYKIFDAPFSEDVFPVFGQEKAQEEFFQIVSNFAQQGKSNRIVLLHGPNGSAKSSFVNVIMSALEQYSKQNEGALYKYSWIFPKAKMIKGSAPEIGFGTENKTQIEDDESYAKIDSDLIDGILPSGTCDHPFLLLPKEIRNEFLADIKGKVSETSLRIFSEKKLNPRCKQIFDALEKLYLGDLSKVFKHIRVERYYFSRHYRMGLSSVDPQMNVDANSRQITQDISYQSLPMALRNLNLHEYIGPLVDSSRGICEFSDMLKRPIDSYKYLLSTTENGNVTLPGGNISLDTIFVGTANEIHFDAFKEYPDFASFKARIELVKLPYLLKETEEAKIYRHYLIKAGIEEDKIAPHSIELAAKWAVLTRLLSPAAAEISPDLNEIVTSLSPQEKLNLYDYGKIPTRFSSAEAKLLKTSIPEIFKYFQSQNFFEGKIGASAREIITLLLKANQDERFYGIHPVAVIDQLEKVTADPSLYDYMNIETNSEYHDAPKMVKAIRQEYLKIINEELCESMDLVEQRAYGDYFNDYVSTVSEWVKQTSAQTAVSGREPEILKKVEEIIKPQNEKAPDFRKNLISQIAAASLDNPSERVEITRIFPYYLKLLKEDFFSKRKSKIEKIKTQIVHHIKNETEFLNSEEQKNIKKLLKDMCEQFGYNENQIGDTVHFLLTNYEEVQY